MREKLIELLEDICEKYAPCDIAVVVDHLIANGVTIQEREEIDFDYEAEVE